MLAREREELRRFVEVRYRRKSGKHLLVASLSAFDPKRKSCLLASNRCVAKFGVAKHILLRLKNGFVEPLPARRPFRAIGIQGRFQTRESPLQDTELTICKSLELPCGLC
jgi:hypothetical protein